MAADDAQPAAGAGAVPESGRRTWSGFAKTADWAASLRRTPVLLARRAGYIRDPAEQLADKAAAGTEMAKVLNWFHVMMLGTGMIVGAGVFVSTGAAAQSQAGPAVVLSFLVAGVSSLLSALCYSEFAAEFPLAGGAYNYISMSLGELAAWLVVTTLILEYILAAAAVSRAFSAYFATLIGKAPTFFTFPYLSYRVDFMAGGLVIACCLLLMCTTAGGSWFNLLMTGSQIAVIIIILGAGFSKANLSNLRPFIPFGVGGIFSGASFVFFSFIGFDCVSTLAEEVKDPGRDMPIGIVGCISFVTVVYCLMALCIVLMVPYHLIDPAASFATAFRQVGMPWGSILVGLGAVLGIVTGVLVTLMGVSRIVTSTARTHLLFPVLGRINARTGTPVWATAFCMVAALPLAVLTDLPPLIDMVSAGTLMVFVVVAIALIWKRLYDRDAPVRQQLRAVSLVALLAATGVAFACVYALCTGVAKAAGLAVLGGVALLGSIAIHLTCHQHNRPKYRVPLFPYIPAGSILLNCFLMASLPGMAYMQLAIFFAVVLAFYGLYSVHAATAFEAAQGRGVLAGKAPGLTPGPGGLRSPSAFRSSPSSLMAYAPPSHTAAMHGRWSGGVVRLPTEF
ncbi:CAT1 [Scenedesmus sp. PABB004]|nr:CAT1 [Scenedesmus sp. PABB004]